MHADLRLALDLADESDAITRKFFGLSTLAVKTKADATPVSEADEAVERMIRNVLAKGGLDESDVAKLYIYYHGEGDWRQIEQTRQTIARVQREFYPTPGPAETSLRVAGFAFEDLLIEIEAFAICRE